LCGDIRPHEPELRRRWDLAAFDDAEVDEVGKHPGGLGGADAGKPCDRADAQLSGGLDEHVEDPTPRARNHGRDRVYVVHVVTLVAVLQK
jgi:hypothetical protein